jgi:hypothetical protein
MQLAHVGTQDVLQLARSQLHRSLVFVADVPGGEL